MPDGVILDAAVMHRTRRLPGRRHLRIKRVGDVLVATALLAFLAPLFLLLTGAVRLDGGKAFFGHTRVGLNGRAFRCWKFRSMHPDAHARLEELLRTDPAARAEWDASHKLRKDPRVTPLGRVLRVLSLDELPQLWNVLCGQMSLVGPRPVTAEELARHYRGDAAWYVLVRPGLTGPWQISGRSDTGYSERVRLDVQYAQSLSLRRDLAILGRTVVTVLRRQGAC